MIQPTYISDSKYGNKWYPMDDAPVSLLRTNYLSEFRTEIEKAKVRKNLGIPDEMQMKWGGMSGYVEELRDLIEYMELKWKYTTELSEDITTVALALDFIMELITTYTNQREEVDKVKESVTLLNKDILDTNVLLTATKEALQEDIDANTENIEDLEKNLQLEVLKLETAIQDVNNAITKLNTDLININVDTNILNWIQTHVSETVNYENDKVVVVISDLEKNALINNKGLFVKDLSEDIQTNALAIGNLLSFKETILVLVNKLQATLDSIKDNIDVSIGYITDLDDSVVAPNTVGGITAGTTVGDLRGKTLIDIVDIMLFPTTVRDLVYPTLSYYPSYSLIEVGTVFSRPILTFTQNDAGAEINREETLTLNGSIIDATDYNQLGTYRYTAKVNYEAGEYLKDSKGLVTNLRVEAGYLQATSTYITTYPWYAGSGNSVTKLALVQFNISSGELFITMGGNAVIKLPGIKSKINSFTVDGGLGFTAVNLSGWKETTEELNGITYKVWTKDTAYTSDLPHKINFTLAL